MSTAAKLREMLIKAKEYDEKKTEAINKIEERLDRFTDAADNYLIELFLKK